MDFRFQKDVSDWAEQQGLTGSYDLISLAGAQKAVLDSDTRETALKQIELSFKLHDMKNVMIIAHQDCGAYGGSKAFSSWEDEKEKYIEDLNSAGEIIKEKFTEVSVKKIILTFGENQDTKIEEV